ncbi:hypothetical protein [Algibacter sp. 2305UL17-15]|uniref:hypothetical protein n=1 Tax=Algibacter sp. 2305UL17-15 TaxID=3231268 RepID=UPI00345A0FC1
MKKILFTCLLLLGLSVSGFAQPKNIIQKANEKIEELNSQIIAIDTSLALTDDQITKIQTLHVNRLKDVKQAKKNGQSKDDIKQINKKCFQKIFKEILTKPQVKAQRAGKKRT